MSFMALPPSLFLYRIPSLDSHTEFHHHISITSFFFHNLFYFGSFPQLGQFIFLNNICVYMCLVAQSCPTLHRKHVREPLLWFP